MQVVVLDQERVHVHLRRTRYNRLHGYHQPTNDRQRRDHIQVGILNGEAPLAWTHSS